MTVEKSQDPTSRKVLVCELCKGNGIIPVRLRFGARARIEVIKGGHTELVAYTDKSHARCRCSRGERFQKNFAEFNHEYMVSQYPGGEEIAAEVDSAPRQKKIPF